MVQIRKATAKDLAGICDAYLEFAKAEDGYAKELGPAARANRIRHRQFRKAITEQQRKNIRNKDGLYLVAEDEGKIVGFSYAYIVKTPKEFLFQPPKSGIMDMNCVIPEYRGRGIGSTMIRMREEWLKKHGCKFAYLHVLASNPARKLDEECGYSVQGYTMSKKI